MDFGFEGAFDKKALFFRIAMMIFFQQEEIEEKKEAKAILWETGGAVALKM